MEYTKEEALSLLQQVRDRAKEGANSVFICSIIKLDLIPLWLSQDKINEFVYRELKDSCVAAGGYVDYYNDLKGYKGGFIFNMEDTEACDPDYMSFKIRILDHRIKQLEEELAVHV